MISLISKMEVECRMLAFRDWKGKEKEKLNEVSREISYYREIGMSYVLHCAIGYYY